MDKQEAHKLRGFVAGIERKVNNLIVSTSVMAKDTEEITKKLDRILYYLEGDEKTGRLGVVELVDKNTEFRKKTIWILTSAWGVITVLYQAFKDFKIGK